MSFELTSSAFQNSQPIPSKYTCEGENISHALDWTDPPATTKSFVLINDDPDDDGPVPWVHWLVYNIPGFQPRPARERSGGRKILPDGTLQGLNSFRKIGYGGPCSPTGVHHYTFTLYALDQTVSPRSLRKPLENRSTFRHERPYPRRGPARRNHTSNKNVDDDESRPARRTHGRPA